MDQVNIKFKGNISLETSKEGSVNFDLEEVIKTTLLYNSCYKALLEELKNKYNFIKDIYYSDHEGWLLVYNTEEEEIFNSFEELFIGIKKEEYNT